MNRRDFMELGVGAASLSLLNGCTARDNRRASVTDTQRVTPAALDRAAAAPVLDVSALKTPVIIDSIRLLHNGQDTFVHVRSRDGAQGLSLANGRPYLHGIFEQLVVPYFIDTA